MKKLFIFVFTITLLFASLNFSLVAFADGENFSISQDTTNETSGNIDELEKNGTNASKTLVGRVSTKDEEIAEYTKKMNGNEVNGTVLYYLIKFREYSYPVVFVGLVIASLNYFIIGNKKLEKRESGFRMLVMLIIGLIVFQILPLLFALIAGR